MKRWGVLLLACMSVAHGADRFDAARARIHAKIENDGVPSVAVAVAKDGRVLWEEGFGWADREQRVAADPHTVYLLASISKTFTGVGLMNLVQQGKVSLDAPINDYLGSAKLQSWFADANAVTVRQMANHTSGLAPTEQFFYGEREATLVPPMDLTIARYGNVIRKPGARFEYNNFGYGVLGQVIAQVSGQPFADYMRRHVFQPLNLTRTVVSSNGAPLPNTAILYGPQDERIPRLAFDEPAFVGIQSSAHDLVRFGMFLLGQRVLGQRTLLDAATLSEMRRMTSHGEGIEDDYGVGLYTMDTYEGGPVGVGHGGSMSGSHTNLFLLPEEGLVIAVLTNRFASAPADVRNEILRALYPKWRGKTLPPTPEASKPPSQPPAQWQGEWAGTLSTYEGDKRVALRVQPDGDVHLRIENQPWALVDRASFRDGSLQGLTSAFVPTSDAARRRHTTSLRLHSEGDRLVGVAIANSGPFDGADPYFVFALNYRVELRRAAAVEGLK
jgi:CubicO group peptidase (beta-lactamase class C family)